MRLDTPVIGLRRLFSRPPRFAPITFAALLVVGGCAVGDEAPDTTAPSIAAPPSSRVAAMPPVPTPAPKRPEAPRRVRVKPPVPVSKPSENTGSATDPDTAEIVDDAPAPDADAVGRQPAAPIAPPPSLAVRLKGMSEDQARDLLGPPSAVEEKPPARVWTYRGAACTVRLAFFPRLETLDYRVLSVQASETGGEPASGGCLEAPVAASREDAS